MGLYFDSDPTSYVSPIIDETVTGPVQDEDVLFAEQHNDDSVVSQEDVEDAVTTRSMGVDHQSTMTPTWTAPIEDVIEDASMASWMIDYISGFEIVQTGLKMVDTGLSITEKILHRLEPVRYTKPAIDRIVSVRRHLRAVRHAGRRSARSGLELEKTIGDVSMVGFIAELLQINLMLSFFGFALAPAEEPSEEPVESEHSEDEEDSSVDEEDSIVDEDESETLAEKLSDEKMQEYNSSEDPDYEEASDASEDSLEYNSNTEEVIGEVESCCAPISKTIVEELRDEKLRDYNNSEDSDYKVASGEDERSEESLEYSSNADEEEEQEIEPVSATLVEALSDLKLRDYKSSEDEDYEAESATSESEDGLEYNSNAEDRIEDKQDEPISKTLVEELTDEKLQDYNSGEDPDFVVVSEASEGCEDSLEFSSNAEERNEYSSNAEESHEEEEEVEPVSETLVEELTVEPVSETLVEELTDEKLQDYNSGEDADYVAASDVSEDSLEYSSNAEESNDADDAEEGHDEEESS